MKAIFAIFASFIAVRQTYALAVEARGPHVELRSSATCGNPSDAVAFLRAVNSAAGDHFYTTNVAEMEAAIATLGYQSEGDAAFVFNSQELSTIPFFRLNNPAIVDHFYTTSASERDNAIATLGYISEGTAAFVYPSQICGSIPFFRMVSESATDHFYTTSTAERDNAVDNLGYVDEGIAAFVLPVP